MFINRKDAAEQLAVALDKYSNQDVIVLGIPRGGVETAYYVAKHLNAELALLVARKLGFPGNPELAFGAIAEDGSVYFTPYRYNLSQNEIDEVVAEQQQEVKRRIQSLRKGLPLPDLRNRIVIIADDGIATGATIFASIKMCRNRKAAKVIVAAPVSSPEKKRELEEVADEVLILETPVYYQAVSQVYDDFYNLTDQQALEFIDRYNRENRQRGTSSA